MRKMRLGKAEKPSHRAVRSGAPSQLGSQSQGGHTRDPALQMPPGPSGEREPGPPARWPGVPGTGRDNGGRGIKTQGGDGGIH